VLVVLLAKSVVLFRFGAADRGDGNLQVRRLEMGMAMMTALAAHAVGRQMIAATIRAAAFIVVHRGQDLFDAQGDFEPRLGCQPFLQLRSAVLAQLLEFGNGLFLEYSA